MAIKKVTTGYEVRFRMNGRGSREHKKVFPTKQNVSGCRVHHCPDLPVFFSLSECHSTSQIFIP